VPAVTEFGLTVTPGPALTRGGRDAVDALIGAHDWIGALAHQSLIEPILLSQEHREAFRSWTLDALTYDGKLYGLPATLDTTALIRNVDLAPDPPATMEDLIAMGNNLRYKGEVDETLVVSDHRRRGSLSVVAIIRERWRVAVRQNRRRMGPDTCRS
jgi:ABC-type glycerol-3-phosphate transport system substrate-binding protein